MIARLELGNPSSNSSLLFKSFKYCNYIPEIADISADPSPMGSSLHGLLDREHDGLHPKNELRIGFFVIDYVENVGVVFTTFHMRNLKIEPLVVFVRINIWIQNKVVLSAT